MANTNEMTSSERFFGCTVPGGPDSRGVYWRTAMVGPRLREATVQNNDRKRLRLRDGGKVGMILRYGASDGGELEGYYTGRIVRMARGSEHGMHGADTLIVEVEFETGAPYPRTTIAARHLRGAE